MTIKTIGAKESCEIHERDGHCSVERTPICHWETGKAEEAVKQSQDILPGEELLYFPAFYNYFENNRRNSATLF